MSNKEHSHKEHPHRERNQFEFDPVRQQAYINEIRLLNDEYRLAMGKPKKYMVMTSGCQMNEHDSEKLMGMLAMMGYEGTEKAADADLIILNTCCVRESAELKVYGNIGHMKRHKRRNPNLHIVVCGCMMQQPHVVETLKEKYPYISLIFGTHNLYQFPTLLAHTLDRKGTVVEVWESEGQVIEGMPIERQGKITAYVNIMYGCDNFCTYCIVPSTRGRERSRESSDILKEIRDLVKEGIKEVTLLGQNVNSYGKGLTEKIDFPELLLQIEEIEGLERIRFMTSHPKDFSRRLIEVMAGSSKVCEHLHLPVQSGSDSLLIRMNRCYTKEQYLEIVRDIRECIPGVAITTDLIIGFPGETEKDVEDTLDLIHQAQYDSAFTFLYSPRSGTPAASFKDQIPEMVKKERFEKILEARNLHAFNRNKALLGQVVEVLVESHSASCSASSEVSEMAGGRAIASGRTRQNLVMRFESTENLVGKIVLVKVTQPKGYSLEGELLQVIR